MAHSTAQPKLTSDPHNANKGTVRGLGMVERSLQQYGAGRSILASKDGVILAGNKTYDRAVELGIPVQEIESDGKTLFVIKRTDLSYDDPRAKELAIADNRASETGLEWDADVLTAFQDDGIDLSQFWFEDELAELLSAAEDATEGLTDPDDVPDVPDEPITKPGDVWVLGRHRIGCVDSTDLSAVERFMGERKADILFTDPPYGIGMDIENDDLSGTSLDQFNRDWLATGWAVTADNAPVVVFNSSRTFPSALDAARQVGFEFLRLLTIYKPNDMTFPWRGWLLKSEVILMMQKGKAGFVEVHPYAHDTYVQNHGADTLSADVGGHPAAKQYPVIEDCLSRLAGDVVLDLFLGSGTALIAAEKLGRTCYGVEKSPKYVDVCVKRWEQFTGQTAQRAPEYSGVNT